MRTHYCGRVSKEQLAQQIQLCGWVHNRRDHGGVIFIDLRDREGVVQVVFDPGYEGAFRVADSVRSEYVLQVKGKVRSRPEGMENKELASGEIEVEATEVVILNPSETPAIPVNEDMEHNEELRLKYRYLDLRRPEVWMAIKRRSEMIRALRHYLDEHGFIDIETPFLTKSTPEGARDYLVPSRTHPGKFFALPQSPQLFKQLLMISGVDRYYQVVRCFRDEDLRADRQPEFSQLDLEMSFTDESEIMGLMEDMIRHVFKKVANIELPSPFPVMAYAEAIQRFGSDAPDLRNPLELVEVSDLMQDVEFKVFAAPAKDPKCRVAAMCLPDGNALSRKDIDAYTKFVARYGAKGLAYIKVNQREAGREGLQSPIVQYMPDDVLDTLLSRCHAQSGDLVFFGADRATVVNESMGALRQKLAKDRGLLKTAWCPVWIIDFPMFEQDVKTKALTALHHPFTAPKASIEELGRAPEQCSSRAYDLVLNGFEVGGGSIRIADIEMQRTVFRVLGISDEQASAKFGFFLNALRFGCPPHGGIAFGLDRLAMLLAGKTSIREVMAFPKTQSANCPLTSAPTDVSSEQLKELGIKLRKPSAESE